MEQTNKHETMINELGAALREGMVVLEFTKKDGTTVRRTVTLNDKIIAEAGYQFKGVAEGATKRAVNPNQLNFFEVDAKAWKSCVKANIVKFEVVKPLGQPEQERPQDFRNPE